MKYILGLDIEQSKDFIHNKVHYSDEQLSDPYDYHVMVSALKHHADYLVTLNTKDFPNPLGQCVVISPEKLPTTLPIYP